MILHAHRPANALEVARLRWLVAAVVLSLQACTAIPTFVSPLMPVMVPDMAMTSVRGMSLGGANGPLTDAQSQAVLTRLKRNGADTNIFAKHLALEGQIVGSPLVVGNRVQLLKDGPTTYDAMLAAISAARDHVNMETFIMEDDETGRRFAALLAGMQLRGVQVNLVYDSVGSRNTPRAFFTALAASGVNVLEFNPMNPLLARKAWELVRRDHRKLLIVDGKVAFVGGINISSVYSSGSSGKSKATTGEWTWRDTHMRVEGPVVAEFQKLFMATWTEQQGVPLTTGDYFPALQNQGQDVVRAIGSSPEEAFSQIFATLLSAINSAETQIFLTNAYFVPDPQLLSALERAVSRGVDVSLLLPHRTDSALVFYASRSFYTELLKAGVKIYERQDAVLHAKTALVDGIWSTIGSTNLDWRSFVHNQEINAVMLGQEFGAQMQMMFDNDLKSSRRITLVEWGSRPVLARVKESLARMWARWL